MCDVGEDSTAFPRITVRPDQMGGAPCIRGLRMPVATIVGRIASGDTAAELLADFPDLEPDDIREAMRYSTEAAFRTSGDE
jgi:uncharacterized protein (DUF433 family)